MSLGQLAGWLVDVQGLAGWLTVLPLRHRRNAELRSFTRETITYKPSTPRRRPLTTLNDITIIARLQVCKWRCDLIFMHTQRITKDGRLFIHLTIFCC